APGTQRVVLLAEDLLSLLEQVSRYQKTYTNQPLNWLIAEICAQAGLLTVALPVTAQMSTIVPTFVLHAGQSYRRALDELCHVGWLEYFLDQDETVQFRDLSGAATAVWSYTPELQTLTIGGDDRRTNHVIVLGKPPLSALLGSLTVGEAYDDG